MHKFSKSILPGITAASLLISCSTDSYDEKIVVLTFDDAVRSHLEVVAPVLLEKGFGATFFVTNAWMEDTSNFMQWDEVASLHNMGFEIGNHS
ncbi:MAG: polysaccharide deacetylase family protein [Bacteroidales bacterium]|nr:polysaccharide deacetylase family protein [Bacteroidales bacterium]